MALSNETYQRIEGLVLVSEKVKLVNTVKALTDDLIEEGFEKHEIKEYVNSLVDEIFKHNI